MPHTPRASIRLLLSSCVGLILLHTACAGKQKSAAEYTPPGQTECRIENIVLEGVNSVDEEELLDGLATQEDPGWRAGKVVSRIPILGAEHEYLNSVEFERDKDRIKTFYEARGYFNVVINSALIGCKDGKAVEGREVVVRLKINEGEPTRINAISFEGLEGQPELVAPIQQAIPIEEDEIFVQEEYLRSKDAIERVLSQRSYAYARVRGRVVVDPASKTAQIDFFIDPGPESVFGPPTIEGLTRVDEEYVRDAIAFEPGTPYNADQVQKTQEQLYDLGVFSLVTVQPDFQKQESAQDQEKPQPKEGLDPEQLERSDLPEPQEIQQSDGEDAEMGPLGISDLLDRAQQDAEGRSKLSRQVPIVIRLKEAKNWSGRVGTGFSINSTRQDVHGAFNITSRNFLGLLGKLEQFNTVGYALTPGLLQVTKNNTDGKLSLDDFGNRGVFFDILLRYSQPQLFEHLTTGFIQGNVERDIQETYIGLIPSAAIGLRRQLFTRKLQAEISYNVLYIRYQSFSEDFGKELRLQGLNPNQDNPSLLLEYLEQKIIYDGRDSPIDPRRGVRAQASLQEAGDYIVGGQYRFIKPRIEVDGYLPLGTRFVSAARAGVGTIYNINPDEGNQTLGVPLQSRLYAGGKGSIRSFGPRYFGYFTKDLVDPGPIGSITLLELSVEQRMRLKRSLLDVGDLWGALFFDAGSFSNRQLSFDTAANRNGTISTTELATTLIYGLGGGVYWLTPVGPLRADLAFTLTDLSQDARYQPDPSVIDDPSTPANERLLEQRYSQATLNKLRGFDFYIGIGHSF